MPEDKTKLSELAMRFAELNPSLLRDIIESVSIRFENLEFSNGKYIKGNATHKHYKQKE